MRWSEADCLSRIMLSHAPRQATVSLTLSVRQVDFAVDQPLADLSNLESSHESRPACGDLQSHSSDE
jgi:hypothetical protein